jgi:hypothetical protein
MRINGPGGNEGCPPWTYQRPADLPPRGSLCRALHYGLPRHSSILHEAALCDGIAAHHLEHVRTGGK